MPPMQMAFYWSNNVTILFDFWKTMNEWEYGLSCFFFFMLAILFEFLNTTRYNMMVQGSQMSVQDYEPLVYDTQATRTIFHGYHFKVTLLYIFQVFLSYILMLVIMTFNGGLFISSILGFGTGYFLFGQNRKEPPGKPCH